MTDYDGWEILEPLGEGGQSKVYLARSPKRVEERKRCLRSIHTTLTLRTGVEELANDIYSYARPDLPSELGALKVFKIPSPSLPLQPTGELEISEEVQRLRNEIFALHLVREGLPKLLAANEDQRWIVTELFPEGSLERHIDKYKGTVVPALRAFRSLVVAVVSLHTEGFVHRDIKPANIFVRTPEELVLGDLGIVFMPLSRERITMTDNRGGTPEQTLVHFLFVPSRAFHAATQLNLVEDVRRCREVSLFPHHTRCLSPLFKERQHF
jgi:serine/threonine protein kinase